jgi:hypothetical protein
VGPVVWSPAQRRDQAVGVRSQMRLLPGSATYTLPSEPTARPLGPSKRALVAGPSANDVPPPAMVMITLTLRISPRQRYRGCLRRAAGLATAQGHAVLGFAATLRQSWGQARLSKFAGLRRRNPTGIRRQHLWRCHQPEHGLPFVADPRLHHDSVERAARRLAGKSRAGRQPDLEGPQPKIRGPVACFGKRSD